MSRFLRALIALAALALAHPLAAQTTDGLITRASAHSVDATIEKFEAAAKSRGLTVFGRIDHAAAAESANLKMPRATVIMFGNPRLGTPQFLQTPTLAIDLPLRALVWADAGGKVSVSYNSADYVYGPIYRRHGITGDNAGIAAKIGATLAAITEEATK